jgi:Polyketide cyclase / dehydrase and lipid transport
MTSHSSSDVETVERFIAAPASAIFALIADPSRHPEIDGSGTVRKATSGRGQVELGTKFGMSMKAGFAYSMINEVIEFEQDRRLAWQTKSPNSVLGLMIGGRIWRYELEPAEGGTLVRESWDISKERVKVLVRPLRSRTRDAMTATLQRIDEIVTA